MSNEDDRQEKFAKLVHKLPERYKNVYDLWLQVGMAFHDEWSGTSLEIPAKVNWELWSRGSEKFMPGECDRKWQTFTKGQGKGVKWVLSELYKETKVFIDPETMRPGKSKEEEEEPFEDPMPEFFNSDQLWEEGLVFEPPPAVTYAGKQNILHQGLVYILNGHEGTKKSMFAMHNAKQFLEKGKPVVWVDFENAGPLVYKRFQDHKWTKDITKRLAFKDEEVWENYRQACVDFCANIDPGLIVFDSMTSMRTYSDEVSRSNEAVNKFKGMVADWKNMGWTVLVLAHIAKGERDKEKATTFGSMAVGTQADVVITASFKESSPDISSFVRSKDNHGTYKQEYNLCMIEANWAIGQTLLCEYDEAKLKNSGQEMSDIGLVHDFFKVQEKPYICTLQTKDDIIKEIIIMNPKVTQKRVRDAIKTLENEGIFRKVTEKGKSTFGFDKKAFNLDAFKEDWERRQKEEAEKRKEREKRHEEMQEKVKEES